MQKLLVLALLVGMAHPALAGRHVTVEQLRQFLTEQRTANRSDSDTAGKITSMELSEGLTDGTLDQLAGEFKPGPKTTQALDLLADLSAFLEAPAGEVSVDAPPTMEAQRTMVGGALQFVANDAVAPAGFSCHAVNAQFR